MHSRTFYPLIYAQAISSQPKCKILSVNAHKYETSDLTVSWQSEYLQKCLFAIWTSLDVRVFLCLGYGNGSHTSTRIEIPKGSNKYSRFSFCWDTFEHLLLSPPLFKCLQSDGWLICEFCTSGKSLEIWKRHKKEWKKREGWETWRVTGLIGHPQHIWSGDQNHHLTFCESVTDNLPLNPILRIVSRSFMALNHNVQV